MTNNKLDSESKLKVKDKILAIPKSLIKDMTLDDIAKHIKFTGSYHSLYTTVTNSGVNYKKRIKQVKEQKARKITLKEKLMSIPVEVSRNMTAEEIAKHIGYTGTVNALKVSISSFGIEYKKLPSTSEFVRQIKLSGVDTSNMTIEEIVQHFNYHGNIKSLQTLLWQHEVKYRRVFKASLGFEKLSKMNTENHTVQDLMQMIDYDKNIGSFIVTARKYGIKHLPYRASESDILYLVKKFIELNAWEMKPTTFFKTINYDVYNPTYMIRLIKKKIAQDEEFSKLQK